MKVDNSVQIRNRIEELKREKHAVILAHYYTLPEVQEVADFLGDSLALSVRAQSVDAEIILFAGVHFMVPPISMPITLFIKSLPDLKHLLHY